MNQQELEKLPFKRSPNFCKRDRYYPNRLTHIVIHVTEGDWPGCVSWLCNPRSKVSAHYVISPKGEIVHLVQNSMAAWHCGNANGFTLGIEHAGFVDNPKWMTEEMYSASTDLVSTLCKRYKIPIENIVGHDSKLMRKYKNNHRDPGKYMPWENYLNDIKKILNES